MQTRSQEGNVTEHIRKVKRNVAGGSGVAGASPCHSGIARMLKKEDRPVRSCGFVYSFPYACMGSVS